MSEKTPTVAILTPVGSSVHPFTTKCLIELSHSTLFRSAWWFEMSVDLCGNRNSLLHQAIQDPSFDYALFLDADNWTDDVAIMEVIMTLRELEAAIVGGVYKIRSSPDAQTLVGGQINKGQELFIRDLAKHPEDVIPMDRLNGGAMVCDLNWFRINWSDGPWFDFRRNPKNGHCFLGTEDYVFCDRLRERDAQLYMHKWWILGHAVPNGDPYCLRAEMKRYQ